MSERKVLNKYYPPDFDPSKIPKLRLPKERQYTVRIMAPFNMQCKMCNEYIYKGKKFNAKTENVHNENYLGLRIYRFYIRCPRCISEVVFKTDPENQDYTLEQGATRLFEAAKLLQAAEEKEKKQAEEDAQNPMKVLENRTKDSKLEMEVMENLEELRELNMRQAAINYEEILRQGAEQEAQRLRQQEEDDEAEIRKIFGKEGEDGLIIKRLADDDDDEDGGDGLSKPSPSYSTSNKRATEILTEDSPGPSSLPKKQKLQTDTSCNSSSRTSSKSFLSGLVKVKKSSTTANGTTNGQRPTQGSSLANASLAVSAGQTAQKSASGTEGESSLDTGHKTQKSASGTASVASACPHSSSNVKPESSESKGLPENEGSAKGSAAGEEEENSFARSIREGLAKQTVESRKVAKEKSSGLSLLGGYDFSDSDVSDSASDT